MSLFWLVLLACTWALFILATIGLRHKITPQQSTLARDNDTPAGPSITMIILLVVGSFLSILTIVAIYWLIEGEAKNPFTENPTSLSDFHHARNVQNLKRAALRGGVNLAGQYGRSLASKFVRSPDGY